MRHPQVRIEAARCLHKDGFLIADIARCLNVARQTVRRWVVPGEQERHNRYIADYQRERYVPFNKGDSPSKGRCEQESLDMDRRIHEQRKRVAREMAELES